MEKDRFYTLFPYNTVLGVSLVIIILCISLSYALKNIFCLSLILILVQLLCPRMPMAAFQTRNGVKYVCKNVTRKHNFLAPIIFLIEKLGLSFKCTEEKSMRKWVRIWFIVDTGDLIVFKCYNLFSSQAQWYILRYMKVALTHGLFYNFIVSLLIIKNVIISMNCSEK